MPELWTDLSSNNSLPDLAAYKAAGHGLIVLKASEGTGYAWAQAQTLADQAHAIGLSVGFYHWLRPDADASAQASFFTRLVSQHLKPGDRLMTDFEATNGTADPEDSVRAAQLARFNAVVHAALPGYPVWVYTGNWYLAGKPACQAEVRKWPVVMSDYTDVADEALPNPYGLTYVARQFSQTATVPGVAGLVDYNRALITDTPSGGGVPLTPSPPTVQEDDDMKPVIYYDLSDPRRAFVLYPWGVGVGFHTGTGSEKVELIPGTVRIGLPTPDYNDHQKRFLK